MSGSPFSLQLRCTTVQGSATIQPMADRKSSKPKKPKTARWQRIAMMDKEILDVEGVDLSW